ncbi:hypothetical protein BDZ91DRAFT_219748 [Kalaharituber pfeilii]|nr:hypothetical protein BDZ91DRAFT_219748 [Kalaharituber pfeilii]
MFPIIPPLNISMHSSRRTQAQEDISTLTRYSGSRPQRSLLLAPFSYFAHFADASDQCTFIDKRRSELQ